ncbi:TetR-like C-terminal domain-containing protein, partial [Streptomyces spiralis]
ELAHALRRWALDDPQRYFLMYGTPVPGYRAPGDTTAIATDIMAVLLDACAAVPADGAETALDAHLAQHRGGWGGGQSAPVLRRALTFWTRLHGVLSLELAGQFTGMDFDPAQLFAAELDNLLASR